MIFDVSLGNGAAHSEPRLLVDTARAAEDLGFRALWTSDHLLARSTLPQFARVFEPLIVLAHIAAVTSRIRLGTSVIVLPMRSPFVVAKQAATLDQLSGGRLILGIGVGSFGEEYVNVHADFHTRGARLDEAIRLFRHLWSGSRAPFAGRFYEFADGVFDPLPVERERLPLLIGGRSDAALRRAGREADIWQTTTLRLETFPAAVAKIRSERNGERVEVGTVYAFNEGIRPAREAIQAWERAGAQHLSIDFGPADGRRARMQEFAREFGVGST
ncbi:MAG: TIGR03619 family F420-dependent LLM class oxidoreductase [Chloroflexi bacterium]|nr:TIGR03619 family F420-dependent LLM class oxidoreductase [Chloroflexota bacterium]